MRKKRETGRVLVVYAGEKYPGVKELLDAARGKKEIGSYSYGGDEESYKKQLPRFLKGSDISLSFEFFDVVAQLEESGFKADEFDVVWVVADTTIENPLLNLKDALSNDQLNPEKNKNTTYVLILNKVSNTDPKVLIQAAEILEIFDAFPVNPINASSGKNNDAKEQLRNLVKFTFKCKRMDEQEKIDVEGANVNSFFDAKTLGKIQTKRKRSEDNQLNYEEGDDGYKMHGAKVRFFKELQNGPKNKYKEKTAAALIQRLIQEAQDGDLVGAFKGKTSKVKRYANKLAKQYKPGN